MEDEAESKLDRERGSTDGIKFRMKNMWPNHWKDEKHIKVDEHKEQTIQLVLPPDSPIAKRLAQEENKQIVHKEANS